MSVARSLTQPATCTAVPTTSCNRSATCYLQRIGLPPSVISLHCRPKEFHNIKNVRPVTPSSDQSPVFVTPRSVLPRSCIARPVPLRVVCTLPPVISSSVAVVPQQATKLG
jgi:hypothetical protein